MLVSFGDLAWVFRHWAVRSFPNFVVRVYSLQDLPICPHCQVRSASQSQRQHNTFLPPSYTCCPTHRRRIYSRQVSLHFRLVSRMRLWYSYIRLPTGFKCCFLIIPAPIYVLISPTSMLRPSFIQDHALSLLPFLSHLIPSQRVVFFPPISPLTAFELTSNYDYILLNRVFPSFLPSTFELISFFSQPYCTYSLNRNTASRGFRYY